MNLKLLPLLLCATGIAFGQADMNSSPELNTQPPENLKLPQTEAPPMLGIHWARDFEPNARAANEAAQPEAAQPLARARRSPNMTYHGGVIMPTANTKAIFWGTSWASYSGDKITGMDTWYQGFSNSNYAKTSRRVHRLQRPGRPHATTYGGHMHRHLGFHRAAAIPAPSWRGLQGHHQPRSLPATATTLSTPTCRAATPATAPITASAPATASRVQFGFFFKLDGDAGLRSAGHIGPPLAGPGSHRQRQRPRALRSPHRPRQPRRLVRLPGRGERRQVRVDVRRSAGHLLQRHASGRSRANGPMRPTRPAPATPTAPARRAASRANSFPQAGKHRSQPKAAHPGGLWRALRPFLTEYRTQRASNWASGLTSVTPVRYSLADRSPTRLQLPHLRGSPQNLSSPTGS